jgi:hypothetical protein
MTTTTTTTTTSKRSHTSGAAVQLEIKVRDKGVADSFRAFQKARGLSYTGALSELLRLANEEQDDATKSDHPSSEMRVLAARALSLFTAPHAAPIVVMLGNVLCHGDVDVANVPSEATVRRWIHSLHDVETRGLIEHLKATHFVHLLVDASEKGEAQRLLVLACFWDPVKGCVEKALLAAPALISQKAKHEAVLIKTILDQYGLADKVVTVSGDNASGVQADGGTIGELTKLLGRELVPIGCWLHVLSFVLNNTVAAVFGKWSPTNEVVKVAANGVTLQSVLHSFGGPRRRA